MFDFEEIGKVFDEGPPMFHHMKRVRLTRRAYDSVKLGYLIFADDPFTPKCYFVFKKIGESKKVKLIGACKRLYDVDCLIREDQIRKEAANENDT